VQYSDCKTLLILVCIIYTVESVAIEMLTYDTDARVYYSLASPFCLCWFSFLFFLQRPFNECSLEDSVSSRFFSDARIEVGKLPTCIQPHCTVVYAEAKSIITSTIIILILSHFSNIYCTSIIIW
jgi:hypothetical protein